MPRLSSDDWNRLNQVYISFENVPKSRVVNCAYAVFTLQETNEVEKNITAPPPPQSLLVPCMPLDPRLHACWVTSPLEERPPGSNWLPRPPGSPPLPPEESRSPTGTGPELSPSVRSGDTRSPLSSWSGSCPSNVWWGKSPRISRPTWGSSLPPSWLSRKLPKPTWSDSLRTPTCAPSMPSASPSCQRISNWPDVSVENVLKLKNFLFTWFKNGLYQGHNVFPKESFQALNCY